MSEKDLARIVFDMATAATAGTAGPGSWLSRGTVKSASDPRPAVSGVIVFAGIDAMLAAHRPAAALWDASATRPD